MFVPMMALVLSTFGTAPHSLICIVGTTSVIWTGSFLGRDHREPHAYWLRKQNALPTTRLRDFREKYKLQ